MTNLLKSRREKPHRLVVLGGLLLLLWFVPWVFSFYLGLVVYFPYKKNGVDRYTRAAGPLINILKTGEPFVHDYQIPASCKNAVVAAEDAKFFFHPGIDIESIEIAIKRNEKMKKPKWGASTITQQLVKNVFLSRKRSYLRKLREISGAVLLDLIMSKQQQLVWYFNVVEFGPEIYGINDAAKYYFNKKPPNLTANECITLVALLPSPRRLSQLVKEKRESRAFEQRKRRISQMMQKAPSRV